MEKCARCDGEMWVCETHEDRPWDGTSSRADACGCGAGKPCHDCWTAEGWSKQMTKIKADGRMICSVFHRAEST